MRNDVIGARLRRVAAYSLAGVLPYVGFVALLILSPESMALRPFGGTISLAIYLAFFLFAWPLVIAVLYLRGLGDGARA